MKYHWFVQLGKITFGGKTFFLFAKFANKNEKSVNSNNHFPPYVFSVDLNLPTNDQFDRTTEPGSPVTVTFMDHSTGQDLYPIAASNGNAIMLPMCKGVSVKVKLHVGTKDCYWLLFNIVELISKVYFFLTLFHVSVQLLFWGIVMRIMVLLKGFL